MSVCESSYLAIGSMLSAMCSPNKDKLALEFKKNTEMKLCPREMKQKWVDVSMREWFSLSRLPLGHICGRVRVCLSMRMYTL